MRFLLLLYGDEAAEQALDQDARRRIVDEHMAFSARLRTDGTLVLAEALAASDKARTIRRRDRSVTSGPYAETREQLGGFYLLECADLAEALGIGGGVPDSPGLKVEVRPVQAG
jgi:hypothetical protein